MCNLPRNSKYLLFRDCAPIEILFIPNCLNLINFLLSYELGLASSVISIFFLKPNLWAEIYSNNEKVISITEKYLTIVGIFYPFFALGLGLYFVCQAFNTLLWPVLGTFLRLITIIILFLFLKYYDALNYQNILIVFATIIVLGLLTSIWSTIGLKDD